MDIALQTIVEVAATLAPVTSQRETATATSSATFWATAVPIMQPMDATVSEPSKYHTDVSL